MSQEQEPVAIDHARFMVMLTGEFPEIAQAFDGYGRGLLHCEIGTFARLTEEAIDKGLFWQADKYFHLLDRVRPRVTPEVQNAIDVSYLEYLAFSEATDNRRQAVKRMPNTLRTILLELDGRSRWS